MKMVKTEDRLPTEEDGNNYGNVLALSAAKTDTFEVVSIDHLTAFPAAYVMWGSLKGLDPRPFVRHKPWWA